MSTLNMFAEWKSRKLVWSVAALIIVAGGCIPSLQPIYTDQDVVEEDRIVGRWTSSDESQSWEFTKAEQSSYDLTVVDKQGMKGSFVVRLTRIDGVLFMDLYPARPSEPKSGFSQLHLIRAHTFYRIALSDESLGLSFLNPQWLREQQRKNPNQVSHVQRNNSVLLTEETPALREFLAEHLETEGAFTKPFVLKKSS